MTTANPKGNVTVIASQDLRTKQYKAITNAGAVAGLGGKSLGILQNNPNTGQAATVCTEHLSKAVAGATITKDADLMADANGDLITATGDNVWVIAKAMESAVDNDIFQVLMLPGGKQIPAA